MTWVSQTEMDAMRVAYDERIEKMEAELYRLTCLLDDNDARNLRATQERINAKNTEIEQWKIRHAKLLEEKMQVEDECAMYLRKYRDLQRTARA